MRACQKCQEPDQTVSYRERMYPGLRILCAACYVDARTSSTKAVAFKPREVEDRYTLLARKHGL